jgi:hypothetical protein
VCPRAGVDFEEREKTREPTDIRNLDLLAHRIVAIPSNTITDSFKERTSSKCSKGATYFPKKGISIGKINGVLDKIYIYFYFKSNISL